ncbi:hypothetical protein TARUN_4699 [Trichoderma arundinaceum]|uniref:Uncharacterized protein n=1 Tax=Trichoderma arundinaceum TaxID=490622 RepID=A0A395NNH5_TRIAR|nr:hypothetical protein TARUN_4699 [Trichoderma arundinaceum]
MQQVASPMRPTEEERQLYYYGLPSCPKLVARSSTHVWVNPQRPGPTTYVGVANMYPKTLRPVGRHQVLHQLWNDAASSLRVQILAAVSMADWTAIDILRVGVNEEFRITLMVAVSPDTLSWRAGYDIALRCKSILEAHDVHGVHCEIRESVVSFCTEADSTTNSTTNSRTDSTMNPTMDSPTTSTIMTEYAPKKSATFQLSSAQIPAQDDFAGMYADMSDCLGTKIAMKHMDFLAGTKGLYLSLPPSSTGGEPRILAMTCRHVVIDAEKEGLKTYHRQESGGFKEVIQIDQPTYMDTVKYLRKQATGSRNDADEYSRLGEDKYADSLEDVVRSAMTLEGAMAPFEAASSRVFGQLLFSPEFAYATDPSRGTKWLRDWALIELLPNCHQAPLRSIKNKVYIGTRSKFKELAREGKAGWEGLPEPKCPPVIDGCIELQRVVVPMDEIFKPTHTAKYFDEPAMFVAKYGARGGLTLGLGNTLKSVVRHVNNVDGTRSSTSEEWAIISVNGAFDRQAAFSKRGDSGSCVWDMERRPAGIIGAGCNMNGMNDITYAQPLERLIRDIKAHTFDVSLV